MENSVNAKLELGLERLAKAGHDPDLLGGALQSIHGALEDAFRAQLAADTHVPEGQRADYVDPKKVQWKDLLDAMMLYRDLSQADRDVIWRTNSVRTRVAHGGRYTGSRADLERYAELVQRLCGYTPPAPAATPTPAPARPARPASPAGAARRAGPAAPEIPRAVRPRQAAAKPARSRLNWMAILAATTLLVIIAIAAIARNTTASRAPAPAATPAASPAGSTPAPTAAPTATAAPRAATVRAEDGLNIRADHSIQAAVLLAVANGTRITLIGGPVEAEGHTWWQVDMNGRQGWCDDQFLQLDAAP
ncbi:SH3 domain-containing protein [Kouleothrix sp.]|uniref:SH3 domain-containing protein n=1 Tax=Kouleothrix sp. TaxID=2779161 RepID=UPI003919EF26